jgi:hypothetical protein
MSTPTPIAASFTTALLPVSGKEPAAIVVLDDGVPAAELALLLLLGVLLDVPPVLPQLLFTLVLVLLVLPVLPELAEPTPPVLPLDVVLPEPAFCPVVLFTSVLLLHFDLFLFVFVVLAPAPVFVLVVVLLLAAATPPIKVAPTTPTARICKSFFISFPSLQIILSIFIYIPLT